MDPVTDDTASTELERDDAVEGRVFTNGVAQRVTLHSWSFHQLGTFLTYKALQAGVPFVAVDPAYTSQTCSWCGHLDKRNRVNQATFICRSCGVAASADHNAARNIALRGIAGWAGVTRPDAVPSPQPAGV
jgi:putative transposase